MPTYLASPEDPDPMRTTPLNQLLWIGAALLVAFPLAALEPGPAGAAAGPRVSFSDQRLANGLRVLIAEDHTAPVFSTAVIYDVGSANERPGRTGFAHLFEHMMFKGSAHVGPGEHVLLILNNGGGMNGTTSSDRTAYYETL